ncbi:MAG TPA: hypothetical protein VFG95_03870, partial [Nitrospiria bacterium]|nr:hypothetical protein [Nitrospiria bacterium]
MKTPGRKGAGVAQRRNVNSRIGEERGYVKRRRRGVVGQFDPFVASLPVHERPYSSTLRKAQGSGYTASFDQTAHYPKKVFLPIMT